MPALVASGTLYITNKANFEYYVPRKVIPTHEGISEVEISLVHHLSKYKFISL